MKAKVILVTGTLDSGKTTLLNQLAHNPDIAIVREVAQDLIDLYGYEVTQKPEFQDLVFAEQIAREKAAQQTGKPIIVCDRGIIDIISFCRVIGVTIKSEWQNQLRNRYDKVAIFSKDDIDFNHELYQVDFDMIQYRNQVEKSIRAVLQEISINPIEISGSNEIRMRRFQMLLNEVSLLEGNHHHHLEHR